MIHIYDGRNYVRRMLEVDKTGLLARKIMMDVDLVSGTVFYVWDGVGGNNARRKIFPGYKVGRSKTTQDTYIGIDLVKQALEHTRAIQIEIPGYEADDVIAYLVRKYVPLLKMKAHIYSTDADFLQLKAEFPELVDCDAIQKDWYDIEDIRYVKTLVGDSSDKIPGIPNFGESSWKAADKPKLKQWLDNVVGKKPYKPFAFPSRVSNVEPEKLQKYWDIIGFLPIQDSIVETHTTVGVPDFTKADNMLQEYFQ